MDNLFFETIQFNMFYNLVPAMRENATDIEKDLKELFPLGCNVVQDLGPNAPFDIPCIFGNDKKSKYNMSVSKVNGVFSCLNIDKNTDSLSFLKAFETAVTKYYNSVISKVPDKKTTFCGITATMNFPCDSNAVKRIKDVFLKVSTDKTIHDTSIKLTFVKNDKYYINITISNMRDPNNIKKDIAIIVQLDINDRYRYNLANGVNTFSDDDVLESLLSICKSVISDKLESLIIKGEY